MKHKNHDALNDTLAKCAHFRIVAVLITENRTVKKLLLFGLFNVNQLFILQRNQSFFTIIYFCCLFCIIHDLFRMLSIRVGIYRYQRVRLLQVLRAQCTYYLKTSPAKVKRSGASFAPYRESYRACKLIKRETP